MPRTTPRRSSGAWNDGTNKLYIAIDEFDDIFYVDTPAEWWTDDVWQIHMDAKLWNAPYEYTDTLPEEEWGGPTPNSGNSRRVSTGGVRRTTSISKLPRETKHSAMEPWAKVEFGNTTPPQNGDTDVKPDLRSYTSPLGSTSTSTDPGTIRSMGHGSRKRHGFAACRVMKTTREEQP